MIKVSKTVVIGIDPGYDRVGWSIGEIDAGKLSLKNFGCIETTHLSNIIDRFHFIDSELTKLIDQYHPTELAIETLYFSSNQKTAMRVSEARGVILSVFFRANISIFEYNPMSMKLAVTGNGRADKTQIARMLHLQFHVGDDKILDDALDAVGLTVTHASSRSVTQQLQK